ncbi:hypothetical protein OPV22_017416 [Ensete ventricosum]|uniref:Late embryogenesis abundant protein LEA-2 subgroup domain-containing protein n=1 Tax=Ensete ventricosum TaxID=4639 RepID=A0AAV8PEY0_ENSVE|nr:hypothetical protein OPV22_017416 [Ensete ventricosum]RWW06305.1 hypothetical protein GW17_00030373 [Ensete ventricosum]RZS26561.1 hypothetical protein BHM03_00059918 [Ensete ventricosum]
MSGKDCGDHGKWCERRKRYQRVLGCIVGFIILVLLIILIIWLVLRPTKPRFYLQDAVVLQFNYTGPPSNLLSTVIQVTVASRNPNDRIGIYYDRINVYAAYKYQQISLVTALPPMYQGHNDVVVWSPYIFGPNVPVAPYLCNTLTQDESSGFLIIHVKIDGRIRWKVGSWTSDQYRLFVSCPAFLTFQNGRSGSGATVKFQQMSACSVEV